ncbi:unnamed protein product, partial [Timema podura]|nr:unnamed protein product [Timema podura]
MGSSRFASVWTNLFLEFPKFAKPVLNFFISLLFMLRSVVFVLSKVLPGLWSLKRFWMDSVNTESIFCIMAETNGVELKVEASEEDKLKVESLKVEKETKVEDDIKNDNTTCDLGNKIKSELSGEETSDLEKKIIRQIEYYFGDINLPRDKFLLEQVKL